MKKIMKSIFLCMFLTLSACIADNTGNFMRSEKILDQFGKPSAEMLDILNIFGISHDGTLNGIVSATQKKWLRPAGAERWEISENYENKRDKIIPLLNKIGCTEKIIPSQEKYDYAIVLGALVSRVRSRLAFLIQQWKGGVRFDEIVFLSGERPLNPKLESVEVLLDANNKLLPFKDGWVLDGVLPKTEIEMVKMVFDQADLPEKFEEKVKVTFVNAPMQKKEDGTLRRPNTGDTVDQWLSEEPNPGTCLVISNQPYVGYQDSVVRTLLPGSFSIETVGSGSYEDLLISVYLDNLARWLYQEKKRMGEFIFP